MRSTRYSVTTVNILDATIKNEDIDPNAAIAKSKISQNATWLSSEIPNLDASKLTSGILSRERGGLNFAPVLAGNANKVIRVNAGETALELALAGGGLYTKLDRVILNANSSFLESNTFLAKQLLLVNCRIRANGLGTFAATARFGSAGVIDTAVNYAIHRWNAGIREAGTGDHILIWPSTLVDSDAYVTFLVLNFAASRKLGYGFTRNRLAGGEISFDWFNTTQQITNIQLQANLHGGTNTVFGTGTELEIYGRNFND